MITQLDDRCRLKHPVFVDDQLSMLERVNVALDQEQIGTGLDRQEARAGNVDPMRIPEVLDRSSGGRFQLVIVWYLALFFFF